MKKQYPVMWFKGMPAGPEMLQQQTLYLENLISSYSEICNGYGWGIEEAEFDLTNLSEGFFKLKKLKGLNENFNLFEVDEHHNLQINLKDYKTEFKNDKKLFIYLSYPKNEFTPQANEKTPKYSSEYIEVTDLNDKTEKTGLSFLKINYFLEIGESKSLKHESIPVAQIKFNGMSFSLTSYAYPTQNIGNLNGISEKLKALVTKMKDKIKYLKNIKKLSLESYNQLSGVSNMVFPLEAAIRSKEHPYNIYKILAQSVGYAFNFAKKADIPNIEGYDHNDIAQSVYSLIDYINSNVDSIFESFQLLKFTKTAKHFEIQLKEIQSNHILLAVEKDNNISYEELSNWINSCIIATTDKMESVKEQRSRGAERNRVDNYKEIDVPEIPDMTIVKVQIKPVFISENETLLLVNNNDKLPNPSSVYLIEV